MKHCNLHKLLPDYQLAYHNGYSCETAIIKLVYDILWAMENQQVTAIMALDLSLAFNMVNHEILLSVLKHNFGLEDTVLNWFESYLCPRSCKVSIGKEYSLEQKSPLQCTSRGLCRSTNLQSVLQYNTRSNKIHLSIYMNLQMITQWKVSSSQVTVMMK